LRDLQINRHTAKRGTPIGMRSMFGALMRGRMLLTKTQSLAPGCYVRRWLTCAVHHPTFVFSCTWFGLWKLLVQPVRVRKRSLR